MANFGGILSVARSGLLASQAQISVASQNITNAQTPGYSRQRINQTANWPQQLPFGNFGTGVTISGPERMRNVLLDGTFRRGTDSASYHEERRDTLQGIENVLGEPSSTGLASSLDQFWNAWSDLSTSPTSGAAKGVVRQRGAQVAAQLNSFGNQIAEAQTGARQRLIDSASRVNSLAEQIAEINQRIVSAEASGADSPDMRDQRDMKVDELAALIGATASPQANGSVTVNVGGDALVDGANFRRISVITLANDPEKIAVSLDPLTTSSAVREPMYVVGGQIAGTIDSHNTIYPDALARLDTIANVIVTETNARHSTGFVGATPAGNFFDGTRLTARTIRLDSAIAANVANVASSGVVNASGDNTVALSLAALRETLVNVGGQSMSIGEGYRNVVSGVATQVNSSNGTADAARALAQQTDVRRDSVKGVSIDEEMISLMKFQQSYAAAARLISVVDELSQTLINLGR
jgi:flagellar hook-associated protein 1